MNTFTFKFRGFEMRAVEIDGEPWFVARDGCALLDIDPANALQKLPDREKGALNAGFPGMRGRPPRIITDKGLYRLIMRSRKAEAEEIQDWITDYVLPAIQKDGGYLDGSEKVATGELSGEELVLKAVEFLQKQVDRYHDRITTREFSAQMTRELGVYFDKGFNKRLGTKAYEIANERGVLPAFRKDRASLSTP